MRGDVYYRLCPIPVGFRFVPPSCGFPPHEPHRKCFRRGPRSFPLEREPTISGDTGTPQNVHFAGSPIRRSGTSDGIATSPRCRNLCHLQCARYAKRWRIAGVLSVQPSALTLSPPNLQERLCRCASFGWAAPAPKEFPSRPSTRRGERPAAGLFAHREVVHAVEVGVLVDVLLPHRTVVAHEHGYSDRKSVV